MDALPLALDRSNPAPLSVQLVDALAGAVGRGELALGDRLPSERGLARTLGVSRTTVVTAYRELEARGLVRGQVGRGTFVVGGDGVADDGAPFAWRGRLSAGARRFLDPTLQALVDQTGPGTISFGAGTPALDCFPAEELRHLTDRVLRTGAGAALGLLPTTGHPALRTAIASRHGTESRQVLTVAGAQQGLDLIARCLLDPGDVVVMDRPGYLGAVHTFLAAGATIAGWDIERADTTELEDLLIRHAPKLIYTNPTFQNPTGRTLPIAGRQELLRLARRHRIPVVEDEPYRELPFPGIASPPTLRELDEGGLVIQLGTFSKVLAAGPRLGWVVAPAGIVEQLALVKARTDIAGASLSQLIARELLASGRYDNHLAVLRAEHRRRSAAMADALGRLLPAGALSWRLAEGGLYVWLRLDHPRLEAPRLQAAAARAGVVVVAGPPFYANGGGERRVRLCFTGLPPAGIETGIQRFASAVRALIDGPATDPTGTRPLV